MSPNPAYILPYMRTAADAHTGAHNETEDSRLSTSNSSRDVNEEQAFIGSRPYAVIMDRIYRKLDWRILPALWILHFLTTYGGSAYGNSLTMNFETRHDLPSDVGVTPKQLSIATSIDFVGYIGFDLPMNLIMTKVTPNTWLARSVASVGFTYASYAAIHNPSGFMALRFFSGVASAGVWPGMAYYVSMYYPSGRMAWRIGIYFSAAQISGIIAGLTAAGFQKMDGIHGYYGWQWLFIIYGSITTFVGLTLFWWLPGRPPALERKQTSSSWAGRIGHIFHSKSPLTEEELQYHERDMAHRYTMKTEWTFRDICGVILDPRLWPLIIMYFGVVGVGSGLGTFGTTILKANNPNLSSIDLSLLTAPIWLVNTLAILLFTALSDKIHNYRGFVFSCTCVVMIVGFFVLTFAHYDWSRYGGLLIAGFGLGPAIPICMTWATQIFSARHGDIGAAAAVALVSGLGNLGSVTTTYALYSGYPGDVDRMYRNSNMIMVSLLGISIIASMMCALVQYWAGDFRGKRLSEVLFVARAVKWLRR